MFLRMLKRARGHTCNPALYGLVFVWHGGTPKALSLMGIRGLHGEDSRVSQVQSLGGGLCRA